jgi:predicted ester cyclase
MWPVYLPRGERAEVDDMIAEGDKVFVRARMTGTHQAEFMGIPATGKAINVGIGGYFRIDNGMAVEHWGVMDTGAIIRQLPIG